VRQTVIDYLNDFGDCWERRAAWRGTYRVSDRGDKLTGVIDAGGGAANITLAGARATRDAGMFRKSQAFVPRYQEFESNSLQRRVNKLSVPVRQAKLTRSCR